MFGKRQKPVMDVLPWPAGRGFSGRDAWWDHILSKDERKRLDNLMGLALLDADVHDRLVRQRDDSLLSAFGLSDVTRAWIRGLEVTSLVEMAQAIVAGPKVPEVMAAAS